MNVNDMTAKLISCDAVTYRRLVSTTRPIPHGIFDIGSRRIQTETQTHQIDKPTQDHGRTVADLQEAQQTYQQDQRDTINGHTVPRAPRKDSRRLALEREAKQTPTRTVHVAIPRGEGTAQNHGIDDVRQHLDPEPVHADDVRTRGGAGLARREGLGQLGVVVGHQDAHAQGPQHEERRQPVEDGLVSPGQDLARILGLARGHAHVVRPGDGETRLDQTLQEAQEPAQTAAVVQLRETARVVPVPEPEPVAERVAAEHDDEGVYDQPDDEQDFAQGEPEFGFAVPLDREEVDQGVADDDDGDDPAGRHDVAPVVDDDVAGDDFERHKHGFKHEEVVPSSDAEGFVDVPACEADEWRRDGKVGDHLGHAVGHAEDEGAPIKSVSVSGLERGHSLRSSSGMCVHQQA